MSFYSLLRRAGAIREVALLVLIASCALPWLATPAGATIRTWTAGSGNWSEPSNWSPAGAPQNGDDLVFNNSPGSTMTDDIPGLSVRTLEFHHSGAVVGPNNLTVTVGINAFSADAGTLAMNFPSMILGNDISIEANDGTGRGYTLNCQMQLSGHTLTCYAANFGSSTFYAPISGPGQVIFASGTNYIVSHSGSTSVPIRVAAGYLGLAGNGTTPAVAGPLEIDSGATVFLAGDSAIGDTDTVTILGGGQLLLEGFTDAIGSLVLSNYSGDTLSCTVDATGAALLGLTSGIRSWNDSSSAVPIIKGRLNLVGYAQFNIGGSASAGLEIQAAIGGNGFQKYGAGTLRLSGNNTFSGDVEAIEGTIEAFTSTAFGQTAPPFGVHLEGGNITLQNVAIGNESLFVNSTASLLSAINQCAWAGPVNLGTSLNVVPLDPTFSTRTMDFSGSISGSGGLNLLPAIFGFGSVRLIGSAGNLYTGPTVVGCSLLQLGKPSGINAYAGPLIVGNPGGTATCEARWLNSYQNVGATATLYANGVININNLTEDFGPVTFNGGEVDTGTGTFNIYAPLTVNPAASSAVINGYLGLPPGDNRVFIVGDGATDCDLLVNAVVFGSPGTYFVKQGAGTMCLANANTFDAPTLLETGILDINSDQGLGTWPGVIIFDGATLRISGPGNTGGGVELLGTGVGGTHGAIEVLPGNSFSISGSVLLDASTTLNLGGTLGLNGAVSGTGPLIKTGTAALVFGGAVNNTYSGDTVVSVGSLLMARSANKVSIPGNLVIGPGPAGPTTFARLIQTGGIGGTTVSVNANSLFDLNGYYQALTTLNLKDGGSVHTGVGLLDFPSGGAINVGSVNAFGSHVSAAITGTLGLPPNATLTFNINPFAPFFPFASGPELDLTATIPRPTENLSFAPAGITKNGDGQMRLSGNNTYAGSSFINDGTLTVDGTQPQSPILVNTGTLAGSGTVGHIYMTSSSAIVAPGDSGPGILTCSNLNSGIAAAGTFLVDLNGTTPGSGYDQLNVRGTVNLAGVGLQWSLGFSPPLGQQFDIISNDRTDPVLGTFTGLPDGKKLYIGAVIYQINYEFGGKPGNDVALQGLDTPPPPRLTIQPVPPASVLLVWPTNDPPFSLQTTTNLPATNWLAALPLPAVIGTNNVVTNSVIDAQQFYRLSNP